MWSVLEVMKYTFASYPISICGCMKKLAKFINYKVISGHTMVRYCRAPTMLRYKK